MKNLIYAIVLLIYSCKRERVEIPFNYERNIYLKSIINDSISGNFMFDTGAYGLHLDSLFKTYLKFDGSYHEGRFFEGDDNLIFSVNGFSLLPEYTSTIKAKPTFGKQCDGIVGWDLFKNNVLEIDYTKPSLYVTKGRDFVVDTGFTKIPITFRNNLFYLNLEIMITRNLIINGDFVLDLGFGGSVYLTGETVRKYHLDTINTKQAEFGLDWGLYERRKSVGSVFRCTKINIKPFELIEPTIECSKDTTGVLSGGDYIGLLGNRALEHFDVVIDFDNMDLYLRPNLNYSKKMKFRSAGVGFVDRTDVCDGLVVDVIYRNSQAEKEGIRSGDIITHFDNKPVKDNSVKMIKDFYDNVGKDVLVTFTRMDSVFKTKLRVEEEL